MATFGERLREIRTNRKLTMKQLGEKIGVTESAIGMYERGERNPSYDKLLELADYLQTDLYYLIGKKNTSIRQPVNKAELKTAENYFYNILGFRSDDDLMEQLGNQSLVSLYKELKKTGQHNKDEINDFFGMKTDKNKHLTPENKKSNLHKTDEKALHVPLYQSISCGTGMFVDDQIEEYITLPESLLSSNKNYFCEYADGDSMIGDNINPGDLLVFEKTQTIENGQIGCFCIDDNVGTCKKFYKDDASAIITLQPSNSKYSPIIVTIETMNFHVVGKLSLVISKR